MKRFLTIWALGLLMLTPASAQNYKIQTDSMAWAMVKKSNAERERLKPRYQICADSLLNYIRRHYGGRPVWSSLSYQISAPVSGDDDKLRQITSHIINELSRFPYLQQYSERIDDGTSLRGRYVVKLKPEGKDTSAYVFLKYDRNLIMFKQSHNELLKTPSRTVSVSSTTVDDELSLWRGLIDKFYLYCIKNDVSLQTKIMLREYHGGKQIGCYVSNPAPQIGTRTKEELVRFDDKDSTCFYGFCNEMEMAGREQGTVYGTFHNLDQTFRNDSCEYHYACHTFSNGLVDFIGVAHEDGITYLIHATNENPGICVGGWGKLNWMSEEELNAEIAKTRVFLGVWIHDASTDKLLNTAKIRTEDKDGKVVDVSEPRVNSISRGGEQYRYFCSVLRRDYYKIKVEAEGYEPAYGELTLQPDEPEKQIHIYLKPKAKK